MGGNRQKQQTYSLDDVDQGQHADAGFVCHLTGAYIAGDRRNTEDQKRKAQHGIRNMKLLLEDRCQISIETVSRGTCQENDGTANGDPFVQKKLKLFQDTSCLQPVLTRQLHKQKRQQSQGCHEDRDKSRTPAKSLSDGGSDRHTHNRSNAEA